MHELSLAEAIAAAAGARAAGRRVQRVSVRIGYLRHVVPDSLVFSWEVLTAGTDLDGSELAVEHVPAVVACGACGATTTLDLPILVCGACEGSDVELRSGDEFLLVSIDVAEGVP